MLSAAAVATVASAMLSSASWVKTFKVPYVDAMASPAMWNAQSAHDVSTRTAKSIRKNSIASAISTLDLRKLTMADFGDIDGSR